MRYPRYQGFNIRGLGKDAHARAWTSQEAALAKETLDSEVILQWERAIGLTYPDDRLAMHKTYLALREHTDNGRAHLYINTVMRWKYSKNPFELDLMIDDCSKNSIPIVGVMLDAIGEAALMRLEGRKTPRATIDSLWREYADDEIIGVMAVCYGISGNLKDSATAAAIAHNENWANKLGKETTGYSVFRRYEEWRATNDGKGLTFEQHASLMASSALKAEKKQIYDDLLRRAKLHDAPRGGLA